MRDILRGALKYNIIGIVSLTVLYFLKYDMNKTHLKEILLILFLGELSYWLTIIVGLLIIKKLKK